MKDSTQVPLTPDTNPQPLRTLQLFLCHKEHNKKNTPNSCSGHITFLWLNKFVNWISLRCVKQMEYNSQETDFQRVKALLRIYQTI